MSTVGRVYTNLRKSQALIKDAARFRTIATVFVKYGFGELLRRLEVPTSMLQGLLERVTPNDVSTLSTAERTFLALQELGPTFVKLGQLLSTRPDLIPAEYITAFSKLQDKVTPIPADAAKARIEASLGDKVETLFDRFDVKPVASASMAQVHRAYTRDGDPVAIKVLRPGIHDTIESDLNILYFLARRLEAVVPELRLLGLVGIITEFDKAISRELDLALELRNLTRFAENFANAPDVHIPKPYPDLSSSDVLTMEFIEGCKITEAQDTEAYNKDKLARTAIKIVFQMILRDGFFHSDLHPGNVLIEKDGTIALLDFGLAGRLTPSMRDRVIDLLVGLWREDWNSVADVFYDIGIKEAPVPFEAFQNDVIDVMEEYLVGKRLEDVEVGGFLKTLADGAIRYKMRIPSAYTMMFKAVMTAEGIGKSLVPSLDVVAEAQPYVEEAIKERYSPDRLGQEFMRHLIGLDRLLKKLPVTAREVLDGIEGGRIRFGIDEEQLSKLRESEQRNNARQTSATLVAGLAVASALATVSPDVPIAFPAAGLVVTGLLGLRLLWALFRSGL